MSNYFDSSDVKNLDIVNYFEHKSWLIIDNAPSIRSALRKTITLLGSKLSNMYEADNFMDAKEIILKKKPHFILGNKNINGGEVTALLEIHLKNVTNRINSGFFILTEENANSEVAMTLDYELDGLISLPFTGASAINCILSGTKQKISPTPYVKKINQGQEKYLKGDLDDSFKIFEASIPLHKFPYEAYYFIGQIHNDKNALELAEEAYRHSIENNPKYYKALSQLTDTCYTLKKYKEAYDAALQMAQVYPITSQKIPQLIRLSIINRKYEDINNYLSLFNSIKTQNSETQLFLSAGLVVLGKYFINSGEKENALEALKKAFQFSNGKFEILSSILNAVQLIDSVAILVELFSKTNKEQWPANSEIIHFYALHLTSSNHQEVLNIGENLLKSKIESELIYKGLIERYILMKRKSGLIEGMVMNAINKYPQNREEFEKLLSVYLKIKE